MDSLMISAAAGMRSRLESLDLVANNLANSSTVGFKADRESFSLYSSAESANSDDPSSPLPLIQSRWTDQSQGVLVNTGQALDLALEGPGYLAVDGASGALYTRGGSFRIDKDGRLTTSEGFELQTVEPRRIRLDPNQPFTIGADAIVRQSGEALGQLKVVDGLTAEGLEKRGSTYVAWASGTPAAAGSKTQFRQGMLESSNTNPADSAVRMISVLRQFESLQRAVQMGNEMNKRSVEEVARLGS
jgi:flagellar basal-body rod protein FlgF